MSRFFSKSIMSKLIIQFFLVGFVPLIILAATTYYYARNTTRSEVFSNITHINNMKKNQVTDFLAERMKSLILQSRSQNLASILDNSYYQIAHSLFQDYMKIFGYSDILMLNKSGNVMFSARLKRKDATADPSRLDAPVLQQLAKRIEKINTAAISDEIHYTPTDSNEIFMGAPITNKKGEIQSILVFEINAAQISSLMKDDRGVGQSVETYIVGSDRLMRTASKYSGEGSVLNRKIDTEAVVKSFKSTSGGVLETTDYRGVKVLCAYSPLNLEKRFGTTFDWAIVTKINQDEAFVFLKNLRINIYWTLLLLLVLVFVAGYFQSNAIAKPLKSLSHYVLLMDEGDFTGHLPVKEVKHPDEIEILLQTFARGSHRFRKQIKQMKDSSSLLLSSISQISATASQLSSSASETSSSISEVTTTMEEVKQTSEVSKDKAENVSKSAERTARISRAGKESTENTMAGISRIKKEMNYIAESTVKLSEQTQRIGEIIDTVTDIADQSNILSVNAAIEAAKAGEHGKGFAVVAQEVKSLADQSKEATNQIRAIINDIQKATGAAVMATERGTKTVEEAVELSEQAGDAIDRLTVNVSESSEAALQITASTQQQLSGMDQLSQAMESINDATIQNLDSVRQLEEAIKNLEEMGHTLTNFISTYKV